MLLATSKEEFERRIRKAAERCEGERELWSDLSTTTKLRLAMQAALFSDLESDEGQVAPAVTSIIAAIVDKVPKHIVDQHLERAWKEYSGSNK